MANTVDQKLLKQTKFPPEFNQKVDMKKVNIEVMKRWIAGKISDILGNEDDVVYELCFNLLEGARFPDIKVLQIQLTGFLEKDTPSFCKELWNLCLSAQSNPQGVPKELLEAKKLELIQEKIQAEKAAEDARRRREQDRTREREIDNIRQRERGDRGRGRYRGGRGGRDFDRRPPRDSRSPPRRRNSNDFRGPPSRRDTDTYIPGDRQKPDHPRRPSPSHAPPRSRSHSATPPRRRQGRSPSRSVSRSRTPPRHRRRRSPSRSRSASLTPPSRRHKHSQRSASNDRRRKRARSQSSSLDRGDRARKSPVPKSRSRSPRRYRNGRARSFSASSSRSPPRRSRHDAGRRRRSPSSSYSRSPRRRSPSPRRHQQSEKTRSTPDNETDVTKINSADTRKDRAGDRPESARRSHSHSRSGSPPPKKRRQSIERYIPTRRQQRNTSSPEVERGTREEAVEVQRNVGQEGDSE